MSKRNKSRSRTQAAQPPAPLSQTPPPSLSGSLLRRNWNGIAAIVAIVVSILAAAFTYRQTELTEKAYGRQTGRITANVVAVDYTPKHDAFPTEVLKTLPGEPPEAKPVVIIDTPDRFLDLPFTLTVKNLGEEPVDAIRVEVRAVWDRRVDQALTKTRHFEARDIGLKQVSGFDYSLSQKLVQGHSATVALSRGLLEQMIEVQPSSYPGDLAFGAFEVTAYGRLVGATTFDRGTPMNYVRFAYYWRISGFDKSACEKVVAKMQDAPVVNFDPKNFQKAMLGQ